MKEVVFTVTILLALTTALSIMYKQLSVQTKEAYINCMEVFQDENKCHEVLR